jgi:uncharacterized membrane protein
MEEADMLTARLRIKSLPSVMPAGQGVGFWYTRQAAIFALVLLFFVVLLMSSFVPPMKSEDEPAHLARAYLLSTGRIFLGSKENVTGGMVDTGLQEYMDYFYLGTPAYDVKLRAAGIRRIQRLTWTGTKEFRRLPNTAIYFPLAYCPQALALFLGRSIGMTINDSYYLARFFSLVSVLILLWVASISYPVPLFVVALFITPEALYQLCSASLDGIAFATSTLSAALFMRAVDGKSDFPRWMHIVLLASLFSLATSRINMLSIAVLPAVIYAKRRSPLYLISCALLLACSAAWIGYTLLAVHGMPVRGLSDLGIVQYYATHLTSLFRVLCNTLTNHATLAKYGYTFIGVLGGDDLDVPLDAAVYVAFAFIFIFLALISLQTDPRRLLKLETSTLIVSSVLSLLSIFLIELVVISPHPATVILGVVGRYFYPSLMFLSFAVFNKQLSTMEVKSGSFVISCALGLSVLSVPGKLLSRYWIG